MLNFATITLFVKIQRFLGEKILEGAKASSRGERMRIRENLVII